MNKKFVFVVWSWIVGIILPAIVVYNILDGWNDCLLAFVFILLWIYNDDLIDLGLNVLGLNFSEDEDEEYEG